MYNGRLRVLLGSGGAATPRGIASLDGRFIRDGFDIHKYARFSDGGAYRQA
jgi:hypothetical protein